jgi:hypothetical protein
MDAVGAERLADQVRADLRSLDRGQFEEKYVG